MKTSSLVVLPDFPTFFLSFPDKVFKDNLITFSIVVSNRFLNHKINYRWQIPNGKTSGENETDMITVSAYNVKVNQIAVTIFIEIKGRNYPKEKLK